MMFRQRCSIEAGERQAGIVILSCVNDFALCATEGRIERTGDLMENSRQLIGRKGIGQVEKQDANVQLLWIHKLVKAKDQGVKVKAIPGPDNPADLGTKSFAKDKRGKCVKILHYQAGFVDEAVPETNNNGQASVINLGKQARCAYKNHCYARVQWNCVVDGQKLEGNLRELQMKTISESVMETGPIASVVSVVVIVT